ncbi:MAG: hypothetical protein Q8920_04350 [Bacillota bacterium]|nr:hypothetical protein [Bacillota bacterium]
MTKEVQKETMLLQEYKEGFSEIQKLVEGFEAIQTDSQCTFLTERSEILDQQLKFIGTQRYDVLLEVREFLAKANSKLKAILDTEKFLKGQMEECDEFIKIIVSQNGNDEREKDNV